MKKVIAVVILAMLILGGGSYYYFLGPCGATRVDRASDEMAALFDEWQDAVDIAGSTSRIQLSGPITNLQQTSRDFEKIDVPPCLENTKSLYVESMDLAIDAFLLFMSNTEANVAVSTKLEASQNLLEQATNELLLFQECAPLCN